MNREHQAGAARERTVFSGASAIREFLDPDNCPPIPLVELPDALNPFHQEKVHIYAKLMYLLPLLNMKSLPALNMLIEAQAAGQLDKVQTLVEASSGNTVFSLAIIARHFGITDVKAIVPRDIAVGKLELLRLSGADPMFSPEASNEPTAIEKARSLGEQDGWLNLAQYENPANIESHEKWTSRQIWEQLERKLTVFCAGLGTTGTAIGAYRFFHQQPSQVTVVGVACLPDSAVPGVRNLRRLAEVSFDWERNLDYRVDVGTKESYKLSLAMSRQGLLAGPSSGFALAGLYRFLTMKQEAGEFDQLRNSDGDIVAAFICGDTPLPYVDKYSTHLDPWDF